MNTLPIPTRTIAVGAAGVIAVLLTAVTWAQRPGQTPKLSAVVEQAARDVFPNGRVVEVEYGHRVVRLVEVTVINDGQEHDLVFSQNGVLLSIKQEIDPDDLPLSVRDTVRTVAGHGDIQEAEQIRIVAELGFVPVASPRTEYEAEFRKDGREQEVVVSQDGSIIKTPKKARFTEGR